METYNPTAGQHISQAAENIVTQRAHAGEDMALIFNDIQIIATEGKTAAEIVSEYDAEFERRRAEYLASPEGQEAERQAQLARTIAEKAKNEGILPFTLANEAGWMRTVNENADQYGALTIRYAARWANMMEAKMADGAALENIASSTSHEADKEGITGFLYCIAVSLLADAWVHGEQLRRWHNLKAQLRDEGEKANESGGVLNPAVIVIGNHA